MDPTKLKVLTLRESCTRWGLVSGGTKAELIRCLQEADPIDGWIEEASSAQNQEHTEETSEGESGENNWPLQLEKLDHRQSKLDLRKNFENRTWKVSQPFNEYFHEKLILANAASVENEEIIDYLVVGVPDLTLKNQARIQRFVEKRDPASI